MDGFERKRGKRRAKREERRRGGGFWHLFGKDTKLETTLYVATSTKISADNDETGSKERKYL
jgi:hypothetical protein